MIIGGFVGIKDLAEGNEKDLEYYPSSNKDLLSEICNIEFKNLNF